VSRLSRQCGILTISQPYSPPWSVTGIATFTQSQDNACIKTAGRELGQHTHNDNISAWDTYVWRVPRISVWVDGGLSSSFTARGKLTAATVQEIRSDSSSEPNAVLVVPYTKIISSLIQRQKLLTLWPPLGPTGHTSWLQIQRSQVRFPALPDFYEK
jgi:hypothetical protein